MSESAKQLQFSRVLRKKYQEADVVLALEDWRSLGLKTNTATLLVSGSKVSAAVDTSNALTLGSVSVSQQTSWIVNEQLSISVYKEPTKADKGKSAKKSSGSGFSSDRVEQEFISKPLPDDPSLTDLVEWDGPVKEARMYFDYFSLSEEERKHRRQRWGKIADRLSNILLYGPPGTGKTRFAQAVRKECDQNNIKFLNVPVGKVKDPFVGRSEERLNAIFDYVEAHAPSVVFFDEAEELLSKPSMGSDGGGVQTALVNVYLQRVGGIDSNTTKPPLLIAATNTPPSLLDGAALRRYQAKFFVDLPGKKSRSAILDGIFDAEGYRGFDLDQLLESTEGLSGSEIVTEIESYISTKIRPGEEEDIDYQELNTRLDSLAKKDETERTKFFADAQKHLFKPACCQSWPAHESELRIKKGY